MTSDVQRLAQSLDLRGVVSRYWGDGKSLGDGSVRYRARWDGGDNPTRFAVYKHHFYDYKTGEHGDVYDFLQRELKIDFKESLKLVKSLCGGGVQIDVQRIEVKPVSHSYRSIPDAAWQDEMRRQVRRCADYLHVMPDAKPVLEYLKHVRGISENRLAAEYFGYNEAWRRLNLMYNGRTVWLPPGIIIPRFEYGVMFGVRVRLMTGKVAEKTGILNRELADQKYSSATGSRHVLAAAGESQMKSGCSVVLVEGEFDRAVLMDHIDDSQVTILTMGSASQKLPDRLIPRLRLAKAIYLCLDEDEAGRKAARKLAEQIRCARCFLFSFEDGSKDACDYYEKRGGDGIREWWKSRLFRRVRLDDERFGCA